MSSTELNPAGGNHGRLRILESMSATLKKMMIGAMAASGLVALLALVDLAVGFPFARNVVMDVMFILTAGVIIYMALDAYKDMEK